jgi:uncharacterized protein YecE (DUF72 family)
MNRETMREPGRCAGRLASVTGHPRILIGTVGWSIASRHAGAFAGEGTHLERYARRLDAVEINSSFYRPHRRETYERWAASVPEGFRFSVKLPKSITHERRLADCGGLLDRFISEVSELGAKLGVILVQLPPSLLFQEAVALLFLEDLRSRTEAKIALEPRHGSWFADDVAERLRHMHIARVAADPALFPGADRPSGWEGFAYFRLHGSPDIYRSDYADRLDAILQRLTDLDRKEVWCIFDNTAEGHALGNALSLSERLRSR